MAAAMAAVAPEGNTPTGKRTREILDTHVAKLNNARNKPEYGQIKPLDLICITDGEPSTQASYHTPFVYS